MVSITGLQNAVHQMHKNTAEWVSKNRQKQIQVHNQRNNIVQPNFNVDEFVLVWPAQQRSPALFYVNRAAPHY